MKKLLWLLLVLTAGVVHAQTITTIILVRHAEKASDGSKDPTLSDAGKARALQLATFLQSQSIQGIYSTAYQRTRQTVEPLATAKVLKVEEYDPASKTAVSEIAARHPGGTIVIVGHSNTVPGMVNQLIGREEYKNFDDSDYGNLIIVSLVDGSKNAKVTWLRY